jgi:hypothetical protein
MALSQKPLIVHIHVPKTAGTSFRRLLEKRFGTDHANLYVDDTFFVYDKAYLEEFIGARPSLRSISSHFIRTFSSSLAGREALYVTFLRNPIEQFISYLTYTRKHYGKISDEKLLGCLPPHASSEPLREVARWILSQDRDIPFRENYNVNYFARFMFDKGQHPDGDRYRAERLGLAITTLKSFFFVGLTEAMNESQLMLESLGDRSGIEVANGSIGVENVSRDYRDGLEWTDPADEVGAMMRRSMLEDQALYAWACERFRSAALPNKAK